MGQIFKIREIVRDDELGIVEKEVSASNGTFSFESPIVSQRTNRFDPDSQKVKINEVIRHIDDEVVGSIATRGTKPFSDAVKYEYLPDKFNATIFDLKYNSVPNDETIKIIAHALHSSSQNAIILPAVRTALLQDHRIGRKTPVFSEKKIQDYVHMMRLIMNETEAFVNGKEVIGTVPLIPFRFVRPIINLYLSWNIRALAIDANYKDIIGNIGDFTLILSKINDQIPLNKTLIFACNAGIPHFEQNEAVSDDFLSVFAYVDVLGCTFKPRGGGEPRAKVFSRDKYAYDLFKYPEVSRQFGKAMNYVSLRNYNRSEQRKETLKVRNLLGVESMKKYLQTKSAVDRTLVKRLESVAQNVKIA